MKKYMSEGSVVCGPMSIECGQFNLSPQSAVGSMNGVPIDSFFIPPSLPTFMDYSTIDYVDLM